ncbi:MAG: AMP-binding protein [Novosphingobium sp.]|nr:AMP-binding protein [Novosphingobium sp.]
MEEDAPQRTWLDRVDELAAQHPNVEAVVIAGPAREAFTWNELSRRTAGIAREFARRGVKQGDTVSIRLPNNAAFILSALASWRLGATVLPLRWDMPAPEVEQLFELAKPVLVIAETAGEDRTLSADEVMAIPAADPDTGRPHPAASPAFMIASGGSTGTPKIIATQIDTVLGEGNMRFPGGRSSFADNSDHKHPTHLVCTPLYHTHGFVLFCRTLVEDFRNVIMPKFEVEAFLDHVEQEKITFVALVPTMVVRLVKSETIRSRDLSSLETAILGAGATPDWAVRQWIDVIGPETLLMGYGMSESLVASFIRGSEWLEHPGSVGKPILSDAQVFDEGGNPLPPGEVGELYYRPQGGGEHGFKYLGNAKIRTLPGGWASVGDLGKIDEDGYMYIVDRRTDMVVTGGANVFVTEVEAALLSLPDVADAVVIGLPDPEWSRRVHAIVVLREGASTDGADDRLRAHCRTRLASYKAPRSFEYLPDLGRSDAGKINRQALARAREKEQA